MADLTPEERAGLQPVTKMRQRHERGRIEVMQHGSMWMDGEWLYTLDAARLAELVWRYDEALAHLRKLVEPRPPFVVIAAARHFLAALGEVPK